MTLSVCCEVRAYEIKGKLICSKCKRIQEGCCTGNNPDEPNQEMLDEERQYSDPNF